MRFVLIAAISAMFFVTGCGTTDQQSSTLQEDKASEQLKGKKTVIRATDSIGITYYSGGTEFDELSSGYFGVPGDMLALNVYHPMVTNGKVTKKFSYFWMPRTNRNKALVADLKAGQEIKALEVIDVVKTFTSSGWDSDLLGAEKKQAKFVSAVKYIKADGSETAHRTNEK